MTAEERAYNDKIREQEFARRDAEFARQDRLTAEERAYRERITAQDFERQKSMTADERAYNDRIREQEFARRDAELTRTEASRAQADKFKNELSAIGAFSGDFQAEINRRMAVDPNDPLIPQLQAARQEKIQGQQVDTRKSEIDNINQYYNDFQAEINRRQSTPTKDDDWLIPYLQSARQQKIADQQEAEAKAKAEEAKRAEAERIRLAKEKAAKDLKQTAPGKAPTKPTIPKPQDPNSWLTS
jgi:hypothetical protein